MFLLYFLKYFLCCVQHFHIYIWIPKKYFYIRSCLVMSRLSINMAKILTTKVPRYHLSVEESNPFQNETCQVSVKELEQKQINHAYTIYTNAAFFLVFCFLQKIWTAEKLFCYFQNFVVSKWRETKNKKNTASIR